MLEIYRALRARGAPVRVATHGGPHERELRSAGVPYDVLGRPVTQERCAAFIRSLPGIGPPDQSMWTDEELRTYVEAEAAYFRDHGVRVAVTGWTLTTLLSTRLAGIPLVTEHAGSWVPPAFERWLLPLPSTFTLPHGRWLPKPIQRRLFNAGAPRLKLYTAGFNGVAEELGVEGIPSFPALLLGDLTLVTDVQEVLGIPSAQLESWTPGGSRSYRPGTRLRYVGPIYAKLAVPVPERVKRLLAGSDPIVYVAITSSPPQLIREVVQALRALDVRVLVAATVHDLRDIEDEQVLVEGVLPSHEVMAGVALAVTAGGQGSVQTALASGVPLIGIPLQPEQDLNVALAERQGAARLVPQRDAGSAVLPQTASKMLADGRYRENACRVQRIFAAADGPGAAADAIVALAGESAPIAGPHVAGALATRA